ncbi:MAG: endolytic transglycosylase MltG, partial [Calditrichia bacterium]|nr:endolytic transglycosylase MltG [Calditrichia bacterium]
LQADPTIQYILPGPPRRLLYKDLEIKSPYNTYKYRGLPPGPINNPGRVSIMAAIFPDSTNYMYFVATGDGYHHFSKTLREHNNWKRKFNRIRRKLYGK